MKPIETAPTGPPGFLGLSDDGEGGYDGIEWLQGPQLADGRWLCVNSGNYTRFKAKYWAPIPDATNEEERQMTEKRWHLAIIYRTETGPMVMDYDIEEICEAHDIIERGPDWNAILDVSIQLNQVSEEGITLQSPLQLKDEDDE